MALSSRVINEKNDSSQTAFLFEAGEDLLAGNIVVYHTDGYVLMPDGSGTVVGWVNEAVDSGETAKVYTGTPELPCESDVTDADVGATGYVTTSGTITTSSSDTQAVGKIVAVERTGYCFIKVAFPG